MAIMSPKEPKSEELVNKVLIGRRNGKKVPVSYHQSTKSTKSTKSTEYKRKVSETARRNRANESEAYREKVSIKKSMANWNRKVSPEVVENIKKRRNLIKKLLKIVPREKNYSGVVFKDKPKA